MSLKIDAKERDEILNNLNAQTRGKFGGAFIAVSIDASAPWRFYLINGERMLAMSNTFEELDDLRNGKFTVTNL